MKKKEKNPFVHLHVHSHYSLLDGAAKVPDLVQKAVEYKMPALALTDHGNLFGALEFYQECKKAGIKPIIGYEAYIAPTHRKDKEKNTPKPYHLTLLAKNFTGYKNLLKLASEAYLTGFYYKPRIDKELLEKYKDGLIVLSGCLASEVCRNILLDKNRKIKKAKESIKYYYELFKEDFYIEIQENKIEEQKKVNKVLLKIAKELNIPLVFTNDIHYLDKEDAKPHEILLCIQTGTTIKDENRFKFRSEEFYMKSSEQMYQESKEFPNAAKNTLEIAEKVDLEIPFLKNRLPYFETPGNKSNEEYLRELCEKGLKERYKKITKEIRERFEHEYKVICKMGFAPYFLIVWDFVNYAKSQGIPVGPGRGSAAGSMVSYLLKITNLDPLKYNLIFERFLNEGRKEMPDIDIDFETTRRGEVIEYVARKYGRERVAQIITFGTMASRAVIRDVGRVLDIPLSKVDKIAKKVPQGPKITLEKALETEASLKEIYENDEEARELIDIAKRLEGLNRQPGTHAAGVIIADDDLTNYCPLYKNPDGTIATQYSMDHLVSLGLLKMDFLGLNTLTLIQTTLEFIKKSKNIDLDIEKIPLDDKKTYEMLCRGETKGVFQLESEGMRELVKKLKPDRFEDIIALVALYRPGPLGSGMVDTYCLCKHGKQKPEYKHPVLEKILKETYGIILYQEQAMQIAKELAGFTLSEADRLRKAMGKKKKELMDEYREKFIQGAVKKHNIDSKLAEEIFNLIDYFAGYGFNKSHSAAYALVSYQTAYLKAHYPTEFMAALMTIESQNTDKIVKYIEECKIMGIKILPPDINKSEMGFSITKENSIRFGLSAIKGIGQKALEMILETRKKVKKFESIFHLCENIDTRVVNKQVLEALVKSGSLDCFKKPRKQLFEVIPQVLKISSNIKKQKNDNQLNLFEDNEEINSEEKEESYERFYPKVEEWNENEKLKYEKQTLGFYLSSHPLKNYEKYIKMLESHSLEENTKEIVGEILIGGLINSLKETIIKSGKNQGKKMAYFILEGLKRKYKIICFPDTYNKINKELLKEDNFIFVLGKKNFRANDNLENNKEEIEIIANDINDLENTLQKYSKEIEINIPYKIKEEDIFELRKICGKYRGNCRTFISILVDNKKVIIEVDPKNYITPCSNLFNELSKIGAKVEKIESYIKN